MTHFFTPEEANRTLPKIRGLIVEIVQVKKKLDYSTGNERKESLDRISSLTSKIMEFGVELKDLDLGLIDFPAMRFDEPVYLCWKLGEDQVLYWHDLATGFRGRKLLRSEAPLVP